MVDNYDSFTYNLVDCLRSIEVAGFEVIKNDQLDWTLVNSFDKILISPGPGTPDEAGDLMKLLNRFYQSKSILGICLGHQALAQHFGATLTNLKHPRHGQTASIDIRNQDPLFSGIPTRITGGLYHSWTVNHTSIPADLQVIASESQRIMGIRHRKYDLVGLQFHPESHATTYGRAILQNWIKQ